MSQKRQQQEESSSFDERRPRKTPSLKSAGLEVMNLCKLQNAMEPILEPLIRRVVKEEVDSALKKHMNMKRNYEKDIHHSESRSLQLQFLNAISPPVFTGTRIEGEGSTSMEISLVDSLTGEFVTSGLGSSAKVELVVLEGDFDGDEKDNWTPEEFRNNTLRERDGKKPLLTGDVTMALQDGMGLVRNVMFTDNSSWTRSRKFRLGARLLERISDIRVREARSEPFVVRDHRGELYKKHYPPSLSDDVWRLEKIGKDGAFHKRLRNERINTVKDFLMLLFLDPIRLRNILGAGMSTKMWDIMVDHARTCVLDKTSYFYGASPTNGVVFNVIGQVMGVLSNGQYVHTDKLSEAEKAYASKLVGSAFADREKIVKFDYESSLIMPTSSSLSIVQPCSNLPSEGSCYLEDLSSSYLHQTASSPDYMQSVYSVGGFDDCLQGVDPVEQPLYYSTPASNVDTVNRAFSGNEQLQYCDAIQTSHLELSADIQGAINAFIPYSQVPIHKDQRGWTILVSVLRWCFSIKRMARKTRDGKVPPRYC